MVSFGTRLKQLRTQAGLTQSQLAEKIGITKSVISYYELSDRAPSAEMLIKIAKAFHVSTDYLLDLENGRRRVSTSDLSSEDIDVLQNVAQALRKKEPV